MFYIANVLQRPSNQNDVEKIHINMTSYSVKIQFERPKDIPWCYKKDTNLCIKFTRKVFALLHDHPSYSNFFSSKILAEFILYVLEDLTHSYLETCQRAIGKQCRPRSDAT